MRRLADCDNSFIYYAIRQISLIISLNCGLALPGHAVVVYVINLVVNLSVSTGLVVMIGVDGMGIVVRLVSMVVFVRMTGTVETTDPFVIMVEVTGQVVVLSYICRQDRLQAIVKIEKAHSRHMNRTRCEARSFYGFALAYANRSDTCYDSRLRFSDRDSLYCRS